MLLPDNVHPEHSIFFNGAFVLKALQENFEELNFLDLYFATKNHQEMSMPVFVLCLDWLYLLDVVTLNDQGLVKLCS